VFVREAEMIFDPLHASLELAMVRADDLRDESESGAATIIA
jgi:hypothetical protein